MQWLFLGISLLITIVSVNAADADSAQQANSDSGQQNQQEQELDHASADTARGGSIQGYAMDQYGAQQLSGRNAKMLLVEGQQAMRGGDLVNAMHKVKRSLELDDDDMDAHCLYADIMDEQLRAQTEKDPSLYNKCVDEWLGILRNRYGEEKGMRFRGINPYGDLYHDEERSDVAKKALLKLTGYAPKTFETDAHYLKRVSMPTTEKVSGSVISSKAKLPIQ